MKARRLKNGQIEYRLEPQERIAWLWLRQHKISHTALACSLGISRQQVTARLSEQAFVPPEWLEQMAKLAGCSIRTTAGEILALRAASAGEN